MRIIGIFLPILAACSLRAQFGPEIDISLSTADVNDVITADLDGDGDMDIVSASPGDGKIAWYANDGSGGFGTQRIISSHDNGFELDLYAIDLDGDGDTDVLSASYFNGRVAWYPNDGSGGFGPELTIATGGYSTGSIHAADMDGDGDKDVVYGSYQSPGKVVWYANNGIAGFSPEQIISVEGVQINDVYTSDLDNDGDQDVLTAATGTNGVSWYANDGQGGFGPEQVISSQGQANAVQAADLDNDGDEDVIAGCVFADRVVWYANDGLGGFGAEQVIMILADSPGAVQAADMDGDGDTDVLASTFDHVLSWYANSGAGVFGPQLVISAGSGFGVAVRTADLDNDGDEDVISGSATGAVVYYANNGAGDLGPQHVISATANGPSSVRAADLDGDNDPDALVALEYDDEVVWYANDGQGGFGAKQVITTLVDGPLAVEAVDLDGDGDLDVLSASAQDDKIAWYANDGSGGFGPQQVISAAADGAVSVHAVDMDADGDMDVLFASKNDFTIAWCANDGLAGFGPERIITDQIDPLTDISAADLDGDGQQEVLFARADAFGTNGIGRFIHYPGDVWLQENISQDAWGASSIHTADVDGDGDLDILSASMNDNKIAWYPNNGIFAFGTQQVISYLAQDAREVYTADLDNDGDQDVLSASNGDNKIAWYENDGSGVFGPQQIISTDAHGARSVFAADLDNDGDNDVISASWGGDKIAWYKDHVLSNYQIEGSVFVDTDANGSFGIGDVPLPNAPVSITPQLSAVITGDTGAYTAYVDLGVFQLESQPDPLWTLTTSPAVRTVEVTTGTPVISGIDFGWAPLVDTSIVIPSLTVGAAGCGDTASCWLTFLNQGTRIEQGTITLELDPRFEFIGSTPSPVSVQGNTITWEFDSLSYFGSGLIDLELRLPQPAPPGTSWTNVTTATTADNVGNTTGVFELVQSGTVACAYDPNDKQAEPAGVGVYHAVPSDINALTYTVRFQNTGSAMAYDVMLVDQLDEDLNWSTLQVLGTSHALTGVQIDEHGEAVFRFDDIMLPDSNANEPESHGFIRYRISPADGVPDGTTVTNCASIYFDLNEPVVTNTTLNTLVDCGLFNASITLAGIDSLLSTPGDAYQWFLDGDSIVGADQQGLLALVPGNYSVVVTSIHGCMDESDPFQVVSIGYAEPDRSQPRVRPNPANEQFTILFPDVLPTDVVIDMIDVNGQVARSIRGNGTNRILVPRGDLAAGLYMVRKTGPGIDPVSVRVVLE